MKDVFGASSEKVEKKLVELIKYIDNDLNGQISFEEFYNMMLMIIDGLIEIIYKFSFEVYLFLSLFAL